MNSQITKLLSKKMALPLVLAVGALYLPAALADEGVSSKTVFEKALINQRGHLTAHFDVNRDLGRAWIEVQLIPETPGEFPNPGEPVDFNRAVDVLYYDQATKQVIYRNGTAQVVCAEDSSFLWSKSLKETGQCPLRVSTETRTVDDGFNGHQERVGKVVLQLPSSGAGLASGD